MVRIGYLLGEKLQLLNLSLRLQLGRRFWVFPFFVLLWPGFHALTLLLGWREQGFQPLHAQNGLIGIPMVIFAIGLGVRIIAGEIEQRTLEVTYTVPGGANRVWISKIIAAIVPLLMAEVLLASFAAAFLTPFPISALYGALQGAVFYLVLAMGFGALLRSEITATLLTGVVLMLNGLATGFGDFQLRWSPLFNPLGLDDAVPADVLAATIQNRIGVALLIMAVTALACTRAQRREQLLRV